MRYFKIIVFINFIIFKALTGYSLAPVGIVDMGFENEIIINVVVEKETNFRVLEIIQLGNEPVYIPIDYEWYVEKEYFEFNSIVGELLFLVKNNKLNSDYMCYIINNLLIKAILYGSNWMVIDSAVKTLIKIGEILNVNFTDLYNTLLLFIEHPGTNTSIHLAIFNQSKNPIHKRYKDFIDKLSLQLKSLNPEEVKMIRKENERIIYVDRFLKRYGINPILFSSYKDLVVFAKRKGLKDNNLIRFLREYLACLPRKTSRRTLKKIIEPLSKHSNKDISQKATTILISQPDSWILKITRKLSTLIQCFNRSK